MFHALANLYVELLRIVILLHNFYEHFNARPHHVRLHRTQELVCSALLHNRETNDGMKTQTSCHISSASDEPALPGNPCVHH